MSKSRSTMISTIFGGLKWCGFGVLGVVVGAVAQNTVTEQTQIPIGLAAAVCVAGITAAMSLSRTITKLSDKIDILTRDMADLPCQRTHPPKCVSDDPTIRP